MQIGKLKIDVKISWDENNPEYQIKAALRNGKKLKAVKIYKDWTNCNLYYAKEMIETKYIKYYKSKII